MLYKVLRMVLNIVRPASYISYDSDVELDNHKALTHHREEAPLGLSTSFIPFH